MVFQILLLSFSLALDAFSVSVAGGIKSQKAKAVQAFRVAAFFAGFQAAMPVIGYFLGESMQSFITGIDHWIAFGLLGAIGVKMIKESISEDNVDGKNVLELKTLVFLSIATSIDALVVGITLNLVEIPFFLSIVSIGLVTFILCFVGFLFGKKIGTCFGKKIEIIGGLALIAIGIKILIEHLK
ncbi:MAG: manganese efflux pump MntP family protein [Candidatus Daviesbacteria bacterium]|nr:manganese efflux pump MntP family protein [Candidatus Daviesbacteria bacterium]